jgi:hypothetical protein
MGREKAKEEREARDAARGGKSKRKVKEQTR